VIDVTEILVHWHAGRSLNEMSRSLGANEHRNVRPARRDRVDPFPLAHLQILGQATGIRIDRAGRPPQIGPDPQPPGRSIVTAQNRPLLLKHDGAQHCSPSATGETVPEPIVRHA